MRGRQVRLSRNSKLHAVVKVRLQAVPSAIPSPEALTGNLAACLSYPRLLRKRSLVTVKELLVVVLVLSLKAVFDLLVDWVVGRKLAHP